MDNIIFAPVILGDILEHGGSAVARGEVSVERGPGCGGNTMRKFTSLLISVVVLALCTAPLQAVVINEFQKLLASDGEEGDRFGITVSISGNTAVVGTVYGTTAYVFQKKGSSWDQVAKLRNSDGKALEHGSTSLAISDDGSTIVAGRTVFVRPVGGWSGTHYEDASVLASDYEPGSWFGYSVALSGDFIVVGAPRDGYSDVGAAYVFLEPAGGWSGTIYEWVKLRSSDAEPYGNFGISVAISGDTDTIVVGSKYSGDYQDDNSGYVYSAYVFDFWWKFFQDTEDAKLQASDGFPTDYFGTSVSISGDGDTVVVGAPVYYTCGAESGSAYVFQKPAGSQWWTGTLNEDAKLHPIDGTEDDLIGSSVSMSVDGDTIVVGAPAGWANTGPGSAYLFQMPDDGWSGILSDDVKLLSIDGSDEDYFGSTVSISGNTIIVGAFMDDDNGANSGSAYLFDVSAITCPADLTGDDQVNIDDIFAVLGLWGDCDDPCPPYCDGDLTEDCTVNINDIFAILGEWGPCE